jgi:hypothetical protein
MKEIKILVSDPEMLRSRDGAVDIATGLLAERPRSRSSSPGKAQYFSPRRPNRFWDPSSLLSNGYQRPRREAEHSPPTSAEVKNTWIYTSTPPYVLTAYVRVLISLWLFLFAAQPKEFFLDGLKKLE